MKDAPTAPKVVSLGTLLLLLPYLIPAKYLLYPAWFIVFCTAIRAVTQPPAATSRWARPYMLMEKCAGCIMWAIPRLRPGVTGVMVPRELAPVVKAIAADVVANSSEDMVSDSLPQQAAVNPTPLQEKPT